MPKYHCLLDASAIIKKYNTSENGHILVAKLFSMEEVAISIPNICIPEVVKTFFNFNFRKEINKKERDYLKNIFIEDIKNFSILIHNINDRNIVDTDQVFKVSFTTHCKEKKRIGAIDALVVAVALEMKKSYGTIFLFTSDNHMKKVAEKMKINVIDPEEYSKN